MSTLRAPAWLRPVGWLVGVLLLAAAGWVLPEQGLITADKLFPDALAVAVSAVALAALLGAGRLMRPLLGGQVGAGDWVHDLVGGMLAAALVLTPLAIGRAMSVPLCTALVGMGLFGWLIPSGRPREGPVLDGWAGATLVGCTLLLLPGLPVALAPPLDTDELSWHLAVAGRIPTEGLGLGGWHDPIASRPLTLHLLYAALWVVAGDAGPKVFHLLLSGAFLAGLYTVVRRHAGGNTKAAGASAAMVTALVAGSWTFLQEVGLAFNDIPTALMVLAAVDAGLTGSRRFTALWLAAGAALSFKYSAWTGVTCAYLLYGASRVTWDRDEGVTASRAALGALGEWALLTAGALLVVSPWWVRNVGQGLHPLFPFAGWPADPGFTFVYLDKYGVGRGFTDFLALPWNLVVAARTDTFAFLGRIHPLWIFSLPVLLLGAWRDVRVRTLTVLSLAGIAGWFVGPQWMRHLLPLSPVFALALGLSLAHGSRWLLSGMAVVWLLLLPPQIAESWTSAAKMLPAATGEQPREDFYEENLPAWPAIAWVNTYTDERAKIALLFAGEVHLVDREVHLGSVEDHTPTRWWLHTHGEKTLEVLREEGFTHLIVQHVRFSQRRYGFLEPADFRARFTDLESLLQNSLRSEATLVFEDGRHGVWWIPDKPLDLESAREAIRGVDADRPDR